MEEFNEPKTELLWIFDPCSHRHQYPYNLSPRALPQTCNSLMLMRLERLSGTAEATAPPRSDVERTAGLPAEHPRLAPASAAVTDSAAGEEGERKGAV